MSDLDLILKGGTVFFQMVEQILILVLRMEK